MVRSLIFLGCAACAVGAGPSPASTTAPPPALGPFPETMTLDASPAFRAATMTFTVSGAPPGGDVALAWGTAIGAGPCVRSLGGCFSVVGARPMGVQGTADAAGVARLDVTVPPSAAPGTALAVQAAHVAGRQTVASNPIPVTVLANVDLAPAVRAAPWVVSPGDDLAASVLAVVRNDGLDAGPATHAAFYLSIDAALDPTDRGLGRVPVPALAAGAEATTSSSPLIVPAVAPGAWHLLLVADDLGEAVETDEANNVAAVALTVRPAAADLALTVSAGPDGPVHDGQDLAPTLDVSVSNLGPGDAGAFRVSLFLSDDDAWDPADALLVGGRNDVSSLAAGATVDVALGNEIVPPGAAPGARWLIVVADEFSLVADPDRANNVVAWPLEVVRLTSGDDDHDGLTSPDELQLWGTDPLDPDSDGDERLDGWEVAHPSRDPLVPDEPGAITDLAAGPLLTCALLDDGEAACWGLQTAGSEVAALPPGPFVALAVAYASVCGLRDDGTVACVGDPALGGLAPSGTFTRVAAGRWHHCGVRTSGALACWGRDDAGVVSSAPAGTFTDVAGLLDASCAIAAGTGALVCWGDPTDGRTAPPAGAFTSVHGSRGRHACALDAVGAVTCWGDDREGQASPPPGLRLRDVAPGFGLTCGQRLDGTVTCWGTERHDLFPPDGVAFDDLALTDSTACVLEAGYAVCFGNPAVGFAAPPTGLLTALDAGQDVACGRTPTGALSCWGADTGAAALTPPGGAWAGLTVARLHGCAWTASGATACWGYDTTGATLPPATPLTGLTTGAAHTCGLRADGAVTCWGADPWGQLQAPPGAFSRLVAGESHTCGLRADGTVGCWGRDTDGQASPPPGIVLDALSAGVHHTCGVDPQGDLACWGADLQGEGTPPTDGPFVDVAVGAFTTCGLRANGTVACTGTSTYGLDAPPGWVFASLSIETDTLCGLTPAGREVCWGKVLRQPLP